MSEIKNAVIGRTMLGYEDHGIPTCYLHLNYGSSNQEFGGYDLRFYGVDFILEILQVVGVETWEDLRGKPIRVKADRRKVLGIGRYTEDKWFYPEEMAKELERK